MNKLKINKYSDESGFSLVELAFSMLLFLIITGALFGLLELGRSDKVRAGNQSESLKSARLATFLLGRDLLNAGIGYHRSGGAVPDGYLNTFLNAEADVDRNRDVVTGISVANNVDDNALDATRKNDRISIIYQDIDFNGSNPLRGINEISTDSNIITLKLSLNEVTSVNEVSLVQVYDLFLIEANNTQVLGIVTSLDIGANTISFAFGDPLQINQVRSGGANDVDNSLLRSCSSAVDTICTNYDNSSKLGVTLKKVIWSSYKINSTTGTLERMTYGNNSGANAAAQTQVQPLIYNVRSMQFDYALKNGTTVADPAVGADGDRGTTDDDIFELNKIRQISLVLEIQAAKNDVTSGVRQIVRIPSTFSTRNLQYDDR